MKKISYSLLLLLLLSCEKNLLENAHYPESIVQDLLYTDVGGNFYLKVTQPSEQDETPIEIFFDDVQIDDSTVVLLKDVIDVNSFRLMDDQDCFFRDKNYIYSYNRFSSEDHPLKRLDLNQGEVTIVDGYIFDEEEVYWLGVRFEERRIEVRDSLIKLIPKIS